MLQIAIDGPASAGKSTVAKCLADRLGILLLDTGAMYRAFTLLAIREGIEPEGLTPEKLEGLFAHCDISFGPSGQVLLNGEDVSLEIRSPKVDALVSPMSANPHVREKMVALQQGIAAGTQVVMEGRDIGTVVLKDTPNKFYLDASVDVRAMRRYRQNEERGIHIDLDELKKQIEKRDENDKNKAFGPLKVADGSLFIDTSDRSIAEIVELILEHIRKQDES